jgi:hypothetical protein
MACDAQTWYAYTLRSGACSDSRMTSRSPRFRVAATSRGAKSVVNVRLWVESRSNKEKRKDRLPGQAL